MRMSEGVEWALHSCLALAWLEDEAPLPTSTLAAAFDLPPAYLNKQLQALVKRGILSSTPGVRGGFRLARRPGDITLLDVVTAIEGPDEAFRCQEIRQDGAMAKVPRAEFRQECVIALAMRKADVAWRRALEAQTLADIQTTIDRDAPLAGVRMRKWHEERRGRPRPRRRGGAATSRATGA
jgi:Rrf2 family protein